MKKWISTTAAALVLSASLAGTASASTSGTIDQYVNFRSNPSTSSTILASLKPGTSVQVLEKINTYWLKISVGGKVGYVMPSAVDYSGTAPTPASAPAPKPAPAPAPASIPSDAAAKVIDVAKSLIGVTHYSYGVNRPTSEMDCSAFTKYVFGKVGVSLKWGTRYQKDAGSFVARSDLRPGDLVFFRVGSSSSIGHVGIYLGNGQMIHNTPSADGVTITSITSGYWANRFVTARRVLP